MLKKVIILICLINLCLFNIFFSYAIEDENFEEEIIEKSLELENPAEEKNKDELGLHSEGAVLLEMNTGKVLYDKNMKERLYPASITKILTAILVLENCKDLNDTTVASEHAVNSITEGYTTAGIKIGESFTIEQLLEVMMLRSANEAATILAEYISGTDTKFAELMNEKAKEIGAVDSNFLNANGMHNENHYSTAYDMAIIQQYCMKNPEYRRISGLTSCSLPNTPLYNGETRIFKNTHAFLIKGDSNYYEYAIAGKTGYTTPAKNCLVTCSSKDGFELLAVVLHAEGKVDGVSARYSDTRKLLDYGYSNYRLSNFLKAGMVVDELKFETESKKVEKLNVVLDEGITLVCKKDEVISKDDGKIVLNEIILPIQEGDILGTVTYNINGIDYVRNLKAEKSLNIDEEIKTVSFEVDKSTNMLAIGLIIGLLLVAVMVIIFFIIITIKERNEKLNFN